VTVEPFEAIVICGIGAIAAAYLYLQLSPKYEHPFRDFFAWTGKTSSFNRLLLALATSQVVIFILFAFGVNVFGIHYGNVDYYINHGKLGEMWEAFIPIYAIAGAFVAKWIMRGS
jgi:hypothetical protein